MNKHKIFFILSVLCAILLFSCSSTPEAEPETPVEPAPVEQPEPTPAPQPIPEPAPEPEPIPESEPVVEIPPAIDYSSQSTELLTKVLSARDMAIVAGANSRFEDEFLAVDELLSQARTSVELNANNEDLLPVLQAKLDIYQAFEKICKALDAKERIISLDFINYDKPSYETGDSAVNDAYDLFLTADESKSANLLQKADLALTSYSSVLTVAFKTLSETERSLALSVKAQADEIKAAKAAKDAYAAAQLQFSQADAFFVAKDFESSYDIFAKAHMNFQSLFDEVTIKRTSALAAMDKAKQKEAEVSKYAEEADTIAPLSADDTTEAAQ